MKALPDHVHHYKSTPTFTENTVPQGLLKNHSTRKGIWGLICVIAGELEYTIEDDEKHILTPQNQGVIEPEALHHIKPLGEVFFFIKFYRQPLHQDNKLGSIDIRK